ncbi:MAG: hypothetical protein DMG05_22545 [Acidobacteria bacterium]|nr:MAG: hypothetical protein DMG05_22545 [Acidobacteriota bacterium]
MGGETGLLTFASRPIKRVSVYVAGDKDSCTNLLREICKNIDIPHFFFRSPARSISFGRTICSFVRPCDSTTAVLPRKNRRLRREESLLQAGAIVQNKCAVKIERLRELGHELRRPEADYLRNGIYELRASFQSVSYRILYFFHGKTAVLSHGLTKEQVVPPREIDRALERKRKFESDPERHTLEEK